MTLQALRKRFSRISDRGRRSAMGEEGFSLIEVMVAMVLLLVVMAAVYGIWFGLQDTFVFANDDMIAQEQARMALGEMVEYIRTARLPESPPNEFLKAVMPVARRNDIVVWTDTDRDVNHDLELIRFRVDEAERVLYRDDATIAGASITWDSHRLVTPNVANRINWGDLADGSDWLFTYHDATGTELQFDDSDTGTVRYEIPDPTQIREVHIKLLVDIYADQAPITHELSSVVQPRNLRQY
jgi:prepilin-type N-terminal cleavage/methylation domain-containing protein